MATISPAKMLNPRVLRAALSSLSAPSTTSAVPTRLIRQAHTRILPHHTSHQPPSSFPSIRTGHFTHLPSTCIALGPSVTNPPITGHSHSRTYASSSSSSPTSPATSDPNSPTPPPPSTSQIANAVTSSSAATTSGVATSSRTPLKVTNPRKDEEGNDMTIDITPRAVDRLHHLMATSSPDSALRVTVEPGGCHGFQYFLTLIEIPPSSPVDPEDTIFDQDGAKVVIDEVSLGLLKGSKVDYTMELIGRQFKVVDGPGVKSSCGCGTSFDVQI